jgi:two-component system cell cycle response regulator
MSTPTRRRSDADSEHPKYRALVADDDENYLAWISRVARRFDFVLTACHDGAEAIEAIDGGQIFDIVIVDCEMPRRGGFDVIAALRSSPTTRDAYAVMLTGNETMDTKLRALQTGYDDFLGKSATEIEIAAKLTAARRIVARQRKLDEAVRELYGLATRDELTGLLNRRFFFAEASRCLSEGRIINLVFFDLDRFKEVNDNFGHLAGDRILCDIGALFLRRTRHEDLVARYGGDEFIMMVADLAPPDVERLAQRIAEELASLQWTFGTDTIGVGVTNGVACSTLLAAPTLAKLLSAGDRDLYKNKWLRHSPDPNPSLYEYDARRDEEIASVLDFNMPELEPKLGRITT